MNNMMNPKSNSPFPDGKIKKKEQKCSGNFSTRFAGSDIKVQSRQHPVLAPIKSRKQKYCSNKKQTKSKQTNTT